MLDLAIRCNLKFEFLLDKTFGNKLKKILFMTFVVLKMKPLVQVIFTSWLIVAVVYLTKV